MHFLGYEPKLYFFLSYHHLQACQGHFSCQILILYVWFGVFAAQTLWGWKKKRKIIRTLLGRLINESLYLLQHNVSACAGNRGVITTALSVWHHCFTRLLFLMSSFPMAIPVITHLSSCGWKERYLLKPTLKVCNVKGLKRDSVVTLLAEGSDSIWCHTESSAVWMQSDAWAL